MKLAEENDYVDADSMENNTMLLPDNRNFKDDIDNEFDYME